MIFALILLQAASPTFRSRSTALPPAATYYEAPGPAASHHGLPQRIERAITEAAAKAGLPRPEADARYDDAAVDLAAASTEAATPPYQVVEFAMRRHGIVEPPPHIISAAIGQGDVDDEALIGDLASKLPSVLHEGRYNRLGIGMYDAGRGGAIRLTILLGESYVRLEKVARVVPAGASFTLRGRILPPYHGVDVIVTVPSGAVENPALVREPKAGAGAFRAVVGCGSVRGRRQVEITGEDASGNQVLANFPVYCGTEAPGAPAQTGVDTEVHSPEQAERRIFDLLNEDRQRAHLPPLHYDDKLAAVARNHSRDMHEHDFVGHVSPTTGDAVARMRRAGLAAPVILENVARAYSPEEVERGLMDSPGHRANILSNEATHVGIGVAFGREVEGKKELFATQLFIRRVTPPNLARAADEVLAELNARRARAHEKPIARSAQLDQAAQEFSRKVATGRATRDQGQEAAKRAVELAQGRYQSVGALFTVIPEVSRLPETPVATAKDLAAVGIGVAIGDSKEFGPGALFVTVVLARGR